MSGRMFIARLRLRLRQRGAELFRRFRYHVVTLACLALICSFSTPSFAGLFECTDATGARVFTDRPAQLRHCTPLSVNTTPTTSPVPQASAPLPSQQTLPMAIDPPPAPFLAQPNPGTQALNAPQTPPVTAQPCAPGYNPLNPFAAPPCQAVESPPTPSPSPVGGIQP
jgi:hypothetical protein